jgi:ribosomal protein S18 acetylase RimI-like enzyme
MLRELTRINAILHLSLASMPANTLLYELHRIGQSMRMEGPTAQIQVRKAVEADIPPLCDLLALLFAQEADFTPNAERQTRGLRLIVNQPEVGRILCAIASNTIVGMVNILFTVSTAEGGRAAWMEDMVVHPDWRGQGIGERLLQEAIQEARSSRCRRITLLTDNSNSAAKRFYGRAGFVQSQMVPFRLSL